MINRRLKVDESGQALITLLIFTIVATIVISAAVAVTITTTQSTGDYGKGEAALSVAEAGAEEALIRLLRDPSYGSSTQTLNINGNMAYIDITTNGNTKTVTSRGASGKFVRKIQVVGSYQDKLVINSWQEID